MMEGRVRSVYGLEHDVLAVHYQSLAVLLPYTLPAPRSVGGVSGGGGEGGRGGRWLEAERWGDSRVVLNSLAAALYAPCKSDACCARSETCACSKHKRTRW